MAVNGRAKKPKKSTSNGTLNGNLDGNLSSILNDHTNGNANGHMNGYANGHVNGHADKSIAVRSHKKPRRTMAGAATSITARYALQACMSLRVLAAGISSAKPPRDHSGFPDRRCQLTRVDW